MPATSPTRIDGELYASAATVGAVMSRSAAQQISHWARIGRELEAADSISHGDVAKVLAGRGSYDALNAREQAVVRAEWDERTTEAREGLDLAAELKATGYVEADADGNVVHRKPRRRRAS